MRGTYTRTFASLASLLSLALTPSCGDGQGQEPGKDPRVPLAVQPREPNPTDPTPEAPNTPGSGGVPNLGGEPSAQPENPNATQPPGQPQKPRNAALTVQINGLRGERGNVCLSLFNSPDGFPDSADRAIVAECFTVIGKNFDIKIENIPPGTYAIALWHDENRDGKLNYNFLGIPKEGLAFSENGKPRISPPPGPPSFSSIAFEMKGEERTTSTQMTYLLDFL